MEEQRVHELPLDVVAHQLVGLNMQFGEVTVKRALDVSAKHTRFALY